MSPPAGRGAVPAQDGGKGGQRANGGATEAVRNTTEGQEGDLHMVLPESDAKSGKKTSEKPQYKQQDPSVVFSDQKTIILVGTGAVLISKILAHYVCFLSGQHAAGECARGCCSVSEKP